ncbi:MAG TPA: hypothetical protein VEI80_05260 [Candidatus Acidoferrales bacterium]|nr:hypothetical protein [Candidatus Acidoferrales bacterium]
MSKDQGYGLVILVISILGIILYGWFIYGWPLITLQVTAFLGVALILVIAAWIGYTMATTPPPAPLEPASTESVPGSHADATDGKTEAPAQNA